MSNLTVEGPVAAGAVFGATSAFLFQNIESYAGELWTKPPVTSARDEGKKSRKDIVKAARHLERFSEHIRGGIDKKTDYTVGHALMVNPTPDWEMLGIEGEAAQEALVKSMRREFRNWGMDPRLLQDAEGHYNYGGMMWLAFRNLTGPDGECNLILHSDEKRAKKYGTRWATYLQVIDGDRVDTPAEQATNPLVSQGIAMDADGRMIGMYVRKTHPGDYTGDDTYQYVPRETATGRPVGIHWFVKTRSSAVRGISALVTIIKQTGMVDKFDDAYLAAAIINQVFATWIESAAPAQVVAENMAPAGDVTDQQWGMFQNKLGYYDKAKIRIGGSRVAVMPPGDRMHMEAVNRSMEDPSPLRDGFLRMMASALGLSFEQFAQKFGEANFSSARAAIADAWVGIMRLREWFGQHVAALVYGAVIEEAFKKGRLDLPEGAPSFDEFRASYCACEMFGPSMPQVDPVKEANAAKILLEAKLTSRQAVIATMGKNYVDVFDQIKRERQEAEERGFSLDPLAPGTPGAEVQDEKTDEGDQQDKPKPKKKTNRGGASGRDGDGDGQTDEE